MSEISRLFKPTNDILSALLHIWESAVVETHSFLSPEDIAQIKPDVRQALKEIENLYCYQEDEQILGFIGVADDKIEMLFVDARARGKGVGKQLINFAVDSLNARFVDVNEQNIQGAGFYRHMGFKQIGRSELDGQGRHFPLLHMEKV